jgi:hypothetical protein
MSKTPDPAKDAASAPQSSNSPSITAPPAARVPEIIIRIQVHPSGRLSAPYHKDVMHPKVTTTEFFNWFYNEITRQSQSIGSSSTGKSCPPSLATLSFTLKDAMPFPKSGFLAKGDEGHFVYIRKLIKEQYEKARAFCPGMQEFVVLFTIPGTVGTEMFDEEW